MLESQIFKEEKRAVQSVFKLRINYFLLIQSFVIQLILVNELISYEKPVNILVIIFYVLSFLILVQLIYIFDGKVKLTITQNYLNFEYSYLWMSFNRKYLLSKISNISVEKANSSLFISLNGIWINKEISLLKFTYEERERYTGRLISDDAVYEIHQIINDFLKYSHKKSKLRSE